MYDVADQPAQAQSDGFTAPLADIGAALTASGLHEVLSLGPFNDLDVATVGEVIAEFGRFVSAEIAPLDRLGDVEGSQLGADGRVRTPAGFKEAYSRYVDAGWSAVAFPSHIGGGNMPHLATIALEEILAAANMAFSLCPMLTQGAVGLLAHWGSPEQQMRYLSKLVTGEWTGTMCLTEPDAGSDVGAVRTTAVQADDGWRVSGTKIFITWGDHDLTENTIHLVLARAPGAPPGTKGISLFIVPARRIGPDGALGDRNGVQVVSIEHKLGIHASPTCVLNFDGAHAELVGEVHNGMAEMFTMMNTARLAVGVEGLAVSERAYQDAYRYATQRYQGRRPGSTGSVPIIEHPDVRRMLLAMRARIDASRLLLYRTAAAVDLATHAVDAEIRNRASAMLAFLVPLAKAWPTDVVNEVTSTALQVFGGAGFIEESGIAQRYRDGRITSIYEGTNGIQAIDLIGRKLDLRPGAPLDVLLAEVEAAAESLLGLQPDGQQLGALLRDGGLAVRGAAEWIIEQRAGSADDALAIAWPFLQGTGTVITGMLLAKQHLVEQANRAAGEPWAQRRGAAALHHLGQLVPQATASLRTVSLGAAAVNRFTPV